MLQCRYCRSASARRSLSSSRAETGKRRHRRAGWGSSAGCPYASEVVLGVSSHTANFVPETPEGKFRLVIVSMRAASVSLHFLAGDQPRPALIGQIRPQPINRDRYAVAEADQKVDVRRSPDQPGDAAGETQPSEIDHCFPPADRRQIAQASIPEGPR